MKKTPFRLLLAALPLTLAACASTGPGAGPAVADAPSKSAGPEQILEQRAVERWKLLIGGKAAEAWDYLSPGYRSTVPRETYAANMKDRPVHWKAVRFDSVDCPADAGYCDVTVNVDYEFQSTLPGVGTLASTGPVVERWIGVEGSWYFVPKEVSRK